MVFAWNTIGICGGRDETVLCDTINGAFSVILPKAENAVGDVFTISHVSGTEPVTVEAPGSPNCPMNMTLPPGCCIRLTAGAVGEQVTYFSLGASISPEKLAALLALLP